MYNLWFLADVLVWIKMCDMVGTRRVVKSKFFREIFKMTFSDPG